VRRPPPAPSVLLAVSVGGLAGALLRWQLGVHLPEGRGFPWTTFGINVVGSFMLAALPALAFVRRHVLLPPLLGTGVLGGFTTLSAYAEQGRALLAGGETVLAATYLAGTLAACVAAVLLADRLSSPAEQREFADEEGFE
jgi:fluoride exporter